MIAEDIVWKEEFGIGVDFIDEAHQELFRMVRRIFLMNAREDKRQWAADEGLKYLKNYTLRHFEQEEDYMREIDYPKLAQHQAQHSFMRDRVLPKLERHLTMNKYSPESMSRFLQILSLWLTRHILIHDKAIAGEEPKLTPEEFFFQE